MPFMRQSLRHEIRKHILHGAVFYIDRSLLDMVPDEVELNINMFHLGVVCWVLRE